MKWQYLVTEEDQKLLELGQDGWELVTVLDRNGRNIFYFKKPALSLTERITDEQRCRVYQQLGLEGKA